MEGYEPLIIQRCLFQDPGVGGLVSSLGLDHRGANYINGVTH